MLRQISFRGIAAHAVLARELGFGQGALRFAQDDQGRPPPADSHSETASECGGVVVCLKPPGKDAFANAIAKQNRVLEVASGQRQQKLVFPRSPDQVVTRSECGHPFRIRNCD
jgi:hypothetical protein